MAGKKAEPCKEISQDYLEQRHRNRLLFKPFHSFRAVFGGKSPWCREPQ